MNKILILFDTLLVLLNLAEDSITWISVYTKNCFNQLNNLESSSEVIIVIK